MRKRRRAQPRPHAKPQLPTQDSAAPGEHDSGNEPPEDLDISVRTLRGLFDLMEAQAGNFESLVEQAIGRKLWLDTLDATPDLTRQADVWWNQDLVLQQAKEQLLRSFDRLVDESYAKGEKPCSRGRQLEGAGERRGAE